MSDLGICVLMETYWLKIHLQFLKIILGIMVWWRHRCQTNNIQDLAGLEAESGGVNTDWSIWTSQRNFYDAKMFAKQIHKGRAWGPRRGSSSEKKVSGQKYEVLPLASGYGVVCMPLKFWDLLHRRLHCTLLGSLTCHLFVTDQQLFNGYRDIASLSSLWNKNTVKRHVEGTYTY